MKIIGSTSEIEWIKEALQNNCNHCPYIEACNESAAKDKRQRRKVQYTCKEFLEMAIEFIIEKNAASPAVDSCCRQENKH